MNQNTSELESSCKKMLLNPKIRFVGVLDKMGHKIAGGFRKDIKPYLPDKENQKLYVQMVLDYLMNKDFDKLLGPIDYITSKRGKITMISIPFDEYLILITAERDVNVNDILYQVNQTFSSFPNVSP